MAEQIRVGIGMPSKLTDEYLTLAAQMGAEELVLATPESLGDNKRWEYDDLVRLRERVEKFGLRVGALQNTPKSFVDPFRLGLPDRDDALENYKQTIRNVGKAGIPILTYNFRPDPLYRTGHKQIRGGALSTAFDRSQARNRPLSFGREFTEEQMWANFEYFAKAVFPVAEEAGIKLAVHPDDPPGEAIGGVARIFSSFEGFDRARQIANDSPAFSLLFCIGCWSEMGGNAYVRRGIEHFGRRGQIAYVHFRGVEGEGDTFNECFIGEGPLDVTGHMKLLKDVGFNGFVIDDHAPKMVGDEGWNPRARLYQTGYLMGLLRAVNDLTKS